MANCPICHRYFAKKQLAIDHINRFHGAELGELTAAQLLYASTHGNDFHGKCMVCGKSTEWNDKTLRPYKLCGDPKCRNAVKTQYDKNRDAKLHVSQSELMSDMDHQREMLSHRHIAGRYRFRDGGEVEYVAKLELSFLQFCDRVMDLKSKDILPSPDVFEYFDPKDGRNHSYVPDFYLHEYNLLVEIKDAANLNPAFLEETRYKVVLKDEAMRKQNKYHYIRISGTNYGPFMEILYKITHAEDRKDPNRKTIVMISESVDNATMPVQSEPENVLLLTGFGPENTPKLIGITASTGTWYISDYDERTLYAVTDMSSIMDNTMYRVFRYAGDSDRINKVLTTVRANALNPNESPEWNILEYLKNGGIRFSDNGLANNEDRRTEFVLMDVGYQPDRREETE